MQLESCEWYTIMPDHHPSILSAHFPQVFRTPGLLTLCDLLGRVASSHTAPRAPGQGSIRALTWLLLMRDHKYTQAGREGISSFTLKSLAPAG